MSTDGIDAMMRTAIKENVFPGAVLLVFKKDAIAFFKAYGYANLFPESKMTLDTVFDLASLTKPLATTLAVMKLVELGRLDIEQKLESILPQFQETEKGQIRVTNLLRHNSGLPDYRPYYIELIKKKYDLRKNELKMLLAKEPLLYPIGQTVLYSDLGFMILRCVVEHLSETRLDHFVSEQIYAPLGLEDLFFPGRNQEVTNKRFAATEYCPWRKRIIQGVVHDENAYALGGVEGHAGLFGTAKDLYSLLSRLLAAFHGRFLSDPFKPDLVEMFLKQHSDTNRSLGFDTPSSIDSSCGKYFSKTSVGHLGFTGTSFWLDLERGMGVILLTNRIHPSRDNIKIRGFRPKLHDAVIQQLSTQ